MPIILRARLGIDIPFKPQKRLQKQVVRIMKLTLYLIRNSESWEYLQTSNRKLYVSMQIALRAVLVLPRDFSTPRDFIKLKTVGLTFNCYKDISSVWITNTIISWAFVATLVPFPSDFQRHGDIAVVRESGPKDCRCWKSISGAVKMHLTVLIHRLIVRSVIDFWWSWRFIK